MGFEVNAGTDDIIDGEHYAIKIEDDSYKMSWGCFLNAELKESEKTRSRRLRIEVNSK